MSEKKSQRLLWKKIKLQPKQVEDKNKIQESQLVKFTKNKLIKNDNDNKWNQKQVNKQKQYFQDKQQLMGKNQDNHKINSFCCDNYMQHQQVEMNEQQGKENNKNAQPHYEMVQSIVERLKIQDDSMPNSQTLATNKVPNQLIENNEKIALKRLKIFLKSLKNELTQLQQYILYNKQKIIEQLSLYFYIKISQIQSKLQENKLIYKQKQIQKNIIIQQYNYKIQSLQNQIIKKNNKIKIMTDQINQLISHNQELNQKVFDLDQKISQWDLLIEKRIRGQTTHHSKIITQLSSINELNTNRLERAKSEQELQKLNKNYHQINRKISRLQLGSQKILNNFKKINLKKSLNISNILSKQNQQNQTYQKIFYYPQDKIHHKNSIDQKQQQSMLTHNNENHSISYIHTFDNEKNNKDKIKINSHEEKDIKENQNIYKKKVQSPKVKSSNIFFKNQNENYGSVKVSTIEKHSHQHPPLNKQYKTYCNDLVLKLNNKNHETQLIKITKLGNKINQLRNQIRKQINLTTNVQK